MPCEHKNIKVLSLANRAGPSCTRVPCYLGEHTNEQVKDGLSLVKIMLLKSNTLLMKIIATTISFFSNYYFCCLSVLKPRTFHSSVDVLATTQYLPPYIQLSVCVCVCVCDAIQRLFWRSLTRLEAMFQFFFQSTWIHFWCYPLWIWAKCFMLWQTRHTGPTQSCRQRNLILIECSWWLVHILAT